MQKKEEQSTIDDSEKNHKIKEEIEKEMKMLQHQITDLNEEIDKLEQKNNF